ncbi:SIMPL domain-containing protein [Roseococcus sp. DSY-14]|uniref:SIMPL domain-containing protein n=1 Tax=Roseococcus sp. DSY-14 TaxID=3369650 RepID=UPI00387AF310
MIRRAVIALAVLTPFGAVAQETRLRLGESATVRRAPEEAFARLRVEARAATAASAQAAVNRAVAAALEQAGRVPRLRATTGRYATYRTEDPRGWMATQHIELRGGEAASLAELAGTLQSQGLLLEGIGATLSEAAQREARAEATRLAIARLRERAALVAQELDLRVASIAEIAVDAELPDFRPMPAPMAARAAAAAPPVAAPEDVAIVARVSAAIILSPR